CRHPGHLPRPFRRTADADLGVRRDRYFPHPQAMAGDRRWRARRHHVLCRDHAAGASAAVSSSHSQDLFVSRPRHPSVSGFAARIRKTSSFGDIAILLLLYAQLTLGLATIPVSLGHLDGHEMVRFMTWAQGILTLQPGVSALITDANPIFKLHLFLGMAIFLVFPFTRLVHVWSAPVWYLGRRGYQVVRTTHNRRRVVSRPSAVPAE